MVTPSEEPLVKVLSEKQTRFLNQSPLEATFSVSPFSPSLFSHSTHLLDLFPHLWEQKAIKTNSIAQT